MKVHWRGATHITADFLAGTQNKVDVAMAFLEDALSDGPVVGKDLIEMAKQMGISERTLRRAKGKLKVDSDKSDFDSEWVWKS